MHGHRIATGLALLVALAACSLNEPETLEAILNSPVDEATVTRAYEQRGYQSYELRGRNRFSVSDAAIGVAFEQMCASRDVAPPCGRIQDYRFHLRVDESVVLIFMRREARNGYLEGFACSPEAAGGWMCVAEQE